MRLRGRAAGGTIERVGVIVRLEGSVDGDGHGGRHWIRVPSMGVACWFRKLCRDDVQDGVHRPYEVELDDYAPGSSFCEPCLGGLDDLDVCDKDQQSMLCLYISETYSSMSSFFLMETVH